MRLLRIPVILLAIIGALAGAEAGREYSAQHVVDLRNFDSASVAKLDAQMWRAEHEHRSTSWFRDTIAFLETRYRMGPVMAAVNAYRAWHSASLVRTGKTRADFDRALPDLEHYYADISRLAVTQFDVREAARLELEVSILHRERSSDLDAALAKAQAAIYHLPETEFAEYAQLQATAMILLDSKAERITDDDWERIGKMLNRSWLSLYAVVNGKTLARR